MFERVRLVRSTDLTKRPLATLLTGTDSGIETDHIPGKPSWKVSVGSIGLSPDQPGPILGWWGIERGGSS